MATIQLKNFGGEIPKLSDRLLPDNMAARAENTKLYSGELRAWRNAKQVQQITGAITTTYRVPYGGNDYWLNWGDIVDVIRTPLVNDQYDRRYWTGESGKGPQVNSAQRISTGSTSYNLGVPVNTAAITVTPATTGTPTDEVRYYVITYVTAWGEEGVPCDPVSATGDATGNWTIGNLPTTTIPANNVDKIRIYRTVTGYSSADFFFVGEKTIDATSTFVDSLSNADAALNNLLESSSYDPPPSGLLGLISHPNGFLVGFVGRDIYMSEPYRPHAWPASYITSVAYNIVGFGIVGTTIIVLTESASYALSGVHPSTMVLSQSKIVEPCISKRSIVSFQNGVVYASENGLVFTNGITVDNITLPVMTIEEWDSTYKSTSLMGAKYDDRYIGIKGSEGFIYDFKSQKEAFVQLSSGVTIEGIYSDETTGKVYLNYSQGVYQFDPSDTQITPYTWKSKEFVAPKPLNFGAAQLRYYIPEPLGGTDPGLIAAVTAQNVALGQPKATLGVNTIGKPYDKTIAYAPRRGVLGANGLYPIARLSSEVATVLIRFYADNRLVYEHTTLQTGPFNLPSGYKADIWQFEIVSNVNIQSLDIAESRQELSTL